MDEIGRATRSDTVDIIRRTLEFAERTAPGDREEVTRFAVAQGLAAARHDHVVHDEVDRLWDLLHARGRRLLARSQPHPTPSAAHV